MKTRHMRRVDFGCCNVEAVTLFICAGNTCDRLRCQKTIPDFNGAYLTADKVTRIDLAWYDMDSIVPKVCKVACQESVMIYRRRPCRFYVGNGSEQFPPCQGKPARKVINRASLD